MSNAESSWKRLTLQGNQRFDEGEIDQSVDLYRQALALAMTGFSQWRRADDAVAAVVVSYLNLAEGQARRGDVQQAGATLCALHGGLQRARTRPDIAPELRESALRHLKSSFAAMLRFQSNYGPQPDVAGWLSHCACAACAACDEPPAEAGLQDEPHEGSLWGENHAERGHRTLH